MTQANFFDPNATLDFKYDTEEVQQEIARQKLEEEEAAKAALAEEESSIKETVTPTPEPTPEAAPQEERNEFGDFMAGKALDFVTTGGKETKKRVAAGTIDTLMDGLSTIIPALTPAADWWDEKSGRKTEKDPYKKAERDVSAIVVPNLLGAWGIGAVANTGIGTTLGLSSRTNTLTQIAASFGIDGLVSGVSDTTSEPGNLGTMIEPHLQKILPGATIPWATRDSDSPDVIYANNMLENMVLGAGGELVTAVFALRGGNKIKPLNQKAAELTAIKQVEVAESLEQSAGDALVATVNRARAKKKAAQLGEARRVLAEDPEGVNGYNAFVNEPAEPVSRITLDETANGVDFIADQARIQNNVNTFEGRSRPIINDAEINALSRADASRRAEIMSKVEGDLGAEFSLEVNGQRLTKLEVAEAVNNLYDTALQSEEGFKEAVKGMRSAEVNLFSIIETHSDAGQQALLRETATRLVDSVSPWKQRASAAIQTQAAASVSDISRNIDLMDDVVDTSRLQELVMPRLRVLLKEAETSKIAQRISGELRAKFQKKTKQIDGLLEVNDSYIDDLMAQFDSTVFQAGRKVDDFVDTLTNISKENPAFLRPLYREWAKSNGEIDTLFKLNKYANNRLGVIRKGLVDLNPEVPSIVLRELQGVRQANLLNGLAPAKAWIQNGALLMIKPMTMFAGYVPKALQGDLKPLHRAWYQFSGGMETYRRAAKMARDDLRFANANPDAAMARGRADYNSADTRSMGQDYRKALSDYETFEELSETWDIGKKALWNLTKGLAFWNRKAFNRWGIHGMYAADGFLKSTIASMNSRGKAFDTLIQRNNGKISPEEFKAVEKSIYDQTFDSDGLIKDEYVKFQSEEISLNADVPLVNAFTTVMENVPVLKGLFLYPKTRANQLSLLQTFDPTGVLGGYIERSGKVLRAKTPDQIEDALEAHGMRGASEEDFLALKAEYIGRKAMTSGLVITAGMLALNGRMTGYGPSNPTENKKWRDLGGQPYSFNFGSDDKPDWRSYASAPSWIKTFLGLTSDVVREYSGPDGEMSGGWFQSLGLALEANVSGDLFSNEVETLHGLLSLDLNSYMKYTANLVASTAVPGYSINNTLSSILTPQLQDVEQNWFQHVANRFRWIPSIDEELSDQIDIFTGQSINAGANPFELALSKLLPGFKTKAGNEPWREWLLSTGWSGLKKEKMNRLSKEPLTPPQRKWINDWIGKNLNLDEKVTELMNWDDGKWKKKLEEYKKKRGYRSQADFPVKELFIHEYMDRMVDDAYQKAWGQYEAYNAEAADLGILKEARDAALNTGDVDRALSLAKQIDVLRKTIN